MHAPFSCGLPFCRQTFSQKNAVSLALEKKFHLTHANCFCCDLVPWEIKTPITATNRLLIFRATPSETFLNMKRTIYGHKSHQVTTVLDWFMCCFLFFLHVLDLLRNNCLFQCLSKSFFVFFVKLQALETLQMRRSCKIPSKGCLRCWRHMAPRRTSQWRSYCGIGRIRTATRSVFAELLLWCHLETLIALIAECVA